MNSDTTPQHDEQHTLETTEQHDNATISGDIHDAIQRPPKQKKGKIRGILATHPLLKGFLSFFSFVLSVVLLATLINMFIFQSYYVDGTSMTPNLQPNDRLIINKIPRTTAKITHGHFTPKRGEIIVFNSNLIGTNGQREQLIKRVIGLPGDRVVVKDDHITIYDAQHPNGFDPDKQLGLHLDGTFGVTDEVVPANHIFVFGDNRGPGGSYDSRELGAIPTDDLVGELVMRIVPLNHAKFF